MKISVVTTLNRPLTNFLSQVFFLLFFMLPYEAFFKLNFFSAKKYYMKHVGWTVTKCFSENEKSKSSQLQRQPGNLLPGASNSFIKDFIVYTITNTHRIKWKFWIVFLGVFTKMRKGNIGYVISVRLIGQL